MPETKLDPRRIREHLRKRWPIYIAGALLLCFLNNLVYTVTRPRTPEGALLRVMLVNVNAPEGDLDALAAALLPAAQAAEPGVREVAFEPLTYLGPDDPGSAALLAVKLTAGGADLYIADAAGFEALAAMGGCAPLEEQDFPGARLLWATDADAREACGMRLPAGAIFPGAEGDVYLFASAGADNPAAALAALHNLAEKTSE